jgi:tetratricopeptide (TPR) repeat protein
MQAQTKSELIESIQSKIEQEKILDADALCDLLLKKYPIDDSIALVKTRLIDLKGDRTAAIQYIFNSLAKFPTSFDLHVYAADLCINSSLFDESKVILDRSLTLAKNAYDSIGIYLNIASFYMYKRQSDTSILILTRILEQDSNCLGCYNNLAMVYNDAKDFKSSIKYMKKALQLDSTSAFVCNNIGLALSEVGDYYEAIHYFNKGIQLDPKFAFCYSNLGYAYHKLGDNQKAIKNINTSLELNNQNSWAYRNLALVYISQKKWKEVCIYLRRSEELGFNRFYGEEVNELLSKHCVGK